MADVHVVSHTHWDREWYLTREQFRLRLVDLVDRVLDLFDQEPRFTHFHLDGQTIVLEDYLELRPEARERLERRIREGRLLVGPWYVMPDMFLVGGESLVRNLALGHAVAERFGGVMRAGYIPDPFGHVAQMPQILRGFGLETAILWRGFGGPKAEYLWEAPDGSQVLLLHLPREGYGNAARVPHDLARMGERAAAVVARELARSACETALVMVGTDHLEPHPALPDLVAALAGQPGLRARLSTLPAYAEAVAAAFLGREGALETVRGELRGGEEYAHLLPGVLSARVYLKQANARVERALLRRAEPLAAFAWMSGAPYPAGALAYAWKTLLENHPHDSICGCSVDEVHEENEIRFARAGQVADALVERALDALARTVEPPPPGALRCLLVNTGIEPHRGVAGRVIEVPLESLDAPAPMEPLRFDQPLCFFPAGSSVHAITDPEGGRVPFQVLRGEEVLDYRLSRFEPPVAVRARRLRVAFWAEDVPPCGFTAFDVHLAAEEGVSPGLHHPVSVGEGWLENELLRAEVNAEGSFDVRDRRSGRLLLACGALEDVGDVGDEYNYAPPAEDRVVTSAQARLLRVRPVDHGPLVGSLHVDLELPLPACAAANRGRRSDETVTLPVSLRVRLEAGSPRLGFTLRLDNAARDHRLRVLFPTGARAVEARADSAFAVIRRPARRLLPAAVALEAPVSAAPLQSFLDVGDAHAGVTLLSDGLMEYEVVEGEQARVALTLLRSVGHLSRDDLSTRRGHAGPALPTPGAQCLGRHEFRFALVPRAAPPSEGQLHERARAFLVPPLLASPAGALGRLPSRHCFVRITPHAGEVVLSALKKADQRDSLILRLFNPGQEQARAWIAAARAIASAFLTDLRERRLAALAVEDGAVDLRLPPGRIQTVELVLAER